MNESTLAKKIDALAKTNATEFLHEVDRAVAAALKPYWMPKKAGEVFLREDIRNVLDRFGQHDKPSLSPSQKMIDAFRAKIINDLLAGLPVVKELLLLVEVPPESDDGHALDRSGYIPC